MLFYKWSGRTWCVLLCYIVGSNVCNPVSGTKCYKNEAIGERDGNVYYCDGDKDECCEENAEFTCCEPASSQTLRDQLILWGGLAAVLLLIALVMCYFFKDGNCCKDNVPLSQRCCSCCRRSQDENDLIPEPKARRPYIPQPSWASTSRSFSPDDMRTPPPFNYANKTAAYTKY